MLEQPLARLGRRGAAAVAQQQVLPQLHFEAAHLAADRRLRDAEQARGAAEAAQVDDVDEILELLQVHGGRRVAAVVPCRTGIAASVPMGLFDVPATGAHLRSRSAPFDREELPFKPPSPACSCAAARRAGRSSTPPTCRPTSPLRDRVLLAAMGSPDKRQIDGLGGAHPLTSKVGIVRRGSKPRRRPRLPVRPAAAGQGHGRHHAQLRQHARGRGAVRAGNRAGRRRRATPARCRVLTLNTDMQCDITVQTPGGHVEYEGDARIDGVPGTVGAHHHQLPRHRRLGVRRPAADRPACATRSTASTVTCIDNGMPLVMFRAADVGRTGYESVAELNADTELKARIERLRIACGHAMGLGDVDGQELPEDDADRAAARTAAASARAASSRTSATTRSACSPR